MVLYEGGSSWGPGNFGFLDQIGNGANGVAQALASNGLFGDCPPTSQVITKPGNFIAAVRDSLNTRFDFTGNGSTCSQPPCSPSTNVIKDVVRAATLQLGAKCGDSANMATNTPPRYFPNSPIADLPTTVTPANHGSPARPLPLLQSNKNNPDLSLLLGRKHWRRQLGPRRLFPIEPSGRDLGDRAGTRCERRRNCHSLRDLFVGSRGPRESATEQGRSRQHKRLPDAADGPMPGTGPGSQILRALIAGASQLRSSIAAGSLRRRA